jgi:phosphate transport system ATP-binding protein
VSATSQEPVVEPILGFRDVSIHYGERLAISAVTLEIPERQITSFIGPSGCGKSSLLRAANRLLDLTPRVHVDGRIAFHGADVRAPQTDVIALRRQIGMVFQKPNVFPASIYENVAYGPRVNGLPAVRTRAALDDLVHECLLRAGLWDEVKDGLGESAHDLSGGQQQRLVIARCLAVRPEVILMDEPTSSLDPIATDHVEELMRALVVDHTIVLVTHDLPQAQRVSDRTAFFAAEVDVDGTRHGRLVEDGPTSAVFGSPVDPLTDEFISGRAR